LPGWLGTYLKGSAKGGAMKNQKSKKLDFARKQLLEFLDEIIYKRKNLPFDVRSKAFNLKILFEDIKPGVSSNISTGTLFDIFDYIDARIDEGMSFRAAAIKAVKQLKLPLSPRRVEQFYLKYPRSQRTAYKRQFPPKPVSAK